MIYTIFLFPKKKKSFLAQFYHKLYMKNKIVKVDI